MAQPEWVTDDALARRLEQTEASVAAEFARTHARLFPHASAAVESIAGGVAVFAEIDSPMTQALGLGMQGGLEVAIAEAELDRLEEFFRTRGAAANIEFCPHADNTLRQCLAQRGYVLTEQTNMLARRMDGFTPGPMPAGLIVRAPALDEYEALARAVAVGFMPDAEPPQMLLDLFVTFLNLPSATGYLCEVDGHIAGGGMISAMEDVALLYATSTLTEWRGRGVQRALIDARLSLAASYGCELAVVGATPGSVSLRNLERGGFRIAYTRAKLFHPLAR